MVSVLANLQASSYGKEEFQIWMDEEFRWKSAWRIGVASHGSVDRMDGSDGSTGSKKEIRSEPRSPPDARRSLAARCVRQDPARALFPEVPNGSNGGQLVLGPERGTSDAWPGRGDGGGGDDGGFDGFGRSTFGSSGWKAFGVPYIELCLDGLGTKRRQPFCFCHLNREGDLLDGPLDSPRCSHVLPTNEQEMVVSLLLVRPGAPFVASSLLVAMPFAPSSKI